MIHKILFLIVTIASPLYASITNAPYQLMLGNKDASSAYKDRAMQALKDFHVSDFQQVPVKQMNSIAQALIGSQLYSFTLFGIWLNEELLAQESSAILEYRIYHEAAHYALGHHSKALGIFAITIPAVAAVPVLYKYYSVPHLHRTVSPYLAGQINKWASGLLTTAVAYGVYKIGIQATIKEQEKEADLAAIRLLCKLGKEDVVHAYLQDLNELMAQGFGNETDGWHYTVAQQYEYCLSCFIFNHPNTTQALFNFTQG